jgi:IS30 family transposase
MFNRKIITVQSD